MSLLEKRYSSGFSSLASSIYLFTIVVGHISESTLAINTLDSSRNWSGFDFSMNNFVKNTEASSQSFSDVGK